MHSIKALKTQEYVLKIWRRLIKEFFAWVSVSQTNFKDYRRWFYGTLDLKYVRLFSKKAPWFDFMK